jgi:PAS domain S-box-containing protein
MPFNSRGVKAQFSYSDTIILIILIAGLIVIQFFDFLLFHSLVEIAGIVVSCAIFAFVWSARAYLDDGFFLILGISSLFIGSIDMLHMLAYRGMGVFQPPTTNLATQLWISARSMQALCLLSAAFFLGRKVRTWIVFGLCLITSVSILFSIFFIHSFPVAYIEGHGLSSFKIATEYFVSFVFFVSCIVIYIKRSLANNKILFLVLISTIVTIISEFFFTLYVDPFSYFNMVGHILKIIAVYIMYKAVIVRGFKFPYELLFKNLKTREEELRIEKDKFSQYLDLSAEIIVVIDREQRVSLINKKGCLLLGYSEQEIIGKKWHDTFLPERTREEAKRTSLRLVAGELMIAEYHENYILTKKGEEKLIAWHSNVLRNDSGKIFATLNAGHDITESKKLEEMLRLSHFSIEKAGEGILWINEKAQVCFANEKASSMLGYSNAELISKVVFDFDSRVEPDSWTDRWESIKKTGLSVMETDFKTKSGRLIPVEVTINFIKFGVIEQTCTFFRDITERKKIEDTVKHANERLEILVDKRTKELASANTELNSKMRELERRNETIAEQSRVLEVFFMHTKKAIVFLDKKFNFIRVNDTYARACGRDVREFHGLNHFELYPSSELQVFFQRVVETHIPFEASARPFFYPDHPDRRVTYWDISLVPIHDESGDIDFLIYVLDDVTEKKKALDSSKENEQLLLKVLENLPVGVWIMDKNGIVIRGNTTGRNIWQGYERIPADLLAQLAGAERSAGEDIAPSDFIREVIFFKGKTILEKEVEIEYRAGYRKTFLSSAIPIKNADNEISGALIVSQDITERKLKEMRIEMSNGLLRLFEKCSSLENYIDEAAGLVFTTAGFRITGIRLFTSSERRSCEYYKGFGIEGPEREHHGFPFIESLVRDFLPMVDDDDRELILTPFGSFFIDNSKKISGLRSERIKSFVLELCTVYGINSLAIIPVKYEEKIIGAILLADTRPSGITQHSVELIETLTPLIGEGMIKYTIAEKMKQTEKELELARRLADVGQLAATVAHELRNPLATIKMAVYNIRKKYGNPVIEKNIAHIEKKLSESNQIINNLLFYSRIKTPDFREINISEILDECREQLNERIGKSCLELVDRYASLRTITMEADPLLIKELVTNILNNSCDAIARDDGVIEIGGETIAGNVCKIAFKDNGIGIDPEDIGRVFEPFFSTKSKGTGLGLSVCKQIVLLHHGEISIESVKGQNTIITVKLPIRNKAA